MQSSVLSPKRGKFLKSKYLATTTRYSEAYRGFDGEVIAVKGLRDASLTVT